MLNFSYLIIIANISVKDLIEVKMIDISSLNNTKYTNHGILIIKLFDCVNSQFTV